MEDKEKFVLKNRCQQTNFENNRKANFEVQMMKKIIGPRKAKTGWKNPKKEENINQKFISGK